MDDRPAISLVVDKLYYENEELREVLQKVIDHNGVEDLDIDTVNKLTKLKIKHEFNV